ncbi:P-loop containing nucleoside triphosphate hydrolase protein [Hypoxylon sp. NC0597]|nr:P-loop containing nucleoside triphosphate hydrolase protein [Hypoxylon sp. NC0597]
MASDTGNTSEPRPPVIIFVLGPPGAGKGTLCKSAVEEPNIFGGDFLCNHLSVGDRLRDLAATDLSYKKGDLDMSKIREHMATNTLLPHNVLIPVLEDWIGYKTITLGSFNSVLLVDGFPRSMGQALAFEDKICKPLKVIILECPRDTARERFLSRKRDGADDMERFEKRYNEYEHNMKEIRQRYKDIVETISAEGTPENNIAKFISTLKSIQIP